MRKSETSVSKMLDIEFYLDAAQAHGKTSEPDHEAGDLRDFLRAMWSILTPAQRLAFARHPNVHDTLAAAFVDYEAELKKLD